MRKKRDSVDALGGPLYLLGFMLIATPVIGTFIGLWPLQPGDIAWRVGAIGRATGGFSIPAMGLALIVFLSVRMRHAGLQSLLLATLVGGAAAMLVVVPLWVRDAVRVRAAMPAEALGQFDYDIVKALLTQLVLIAASVYLGLQLWRIGKVRRANDVTAADAGIVMHSAGS